MSVRAAGIEAFGEEVKLLELPEPPRLKAGEVLIQVRAAGVGNWEEFVRTGGWDVGRAPPMALGVEAAGVVVDVGPGVEWPAIGASVVTIPCRCATKAAGPIDWSPPHAWSPRSPARLLGTGSSIPRSRTDS